MGGANSSQGQLSAIRSMRPMPPAKFDAQPFLAYRRLPGDPSISVDPSNPVNTTISEQAYPGEFQLMKEMDYYPASQLLKTFERMPDPVAMRTTPPTVR